MKDWQFDPTVDMWGFPVVGDCGFSCQLYFCTRELNFGTAYQLINRLSIFLLFLYGDSRSVFIVIQ